MCSAVRTLERACADESLAASDAPGGGQAEPKIGVPVVLEPATRLRLDGLRATVTFGATAKVSA